MFTSFSDSCENLLTVVWGPRDEHVTHQAESLPTTVLQFTSSGGPFYPGGVEVGLLDMAAVWLVLAPWFPQLCVVTGGSWYNRFPRAMETGLQAAGKLPSQAFSLLEKDFSQLNVATHSPKHGLFVFAISIVSKVYL